MSGEADPAGRRGTAPVPRQSPPPGAQPSTPSGVDLARVALRAAKEAARARGQAAQSQRRGGAPDRGPWCAPTAANRWRWARRSTG